MGESGQDTLKSNSSQALSASSNLLSLTKPTLRIQLIRRNRLGRFNKSYDNDAKTVARTYGQRSVIVRYVGYRRIHRLPLIRVVTIGSGVR